jgi:hypothetical protein
VALGGGSADAVVDNRVDAVLDNDTVNSGCCLWNWLFMSFEI